MRKTAVAPNSAPIVMEPIASYIGLPVTCTVHIDAPARAHIPWDVSSHFSSLSPKIQS